MRIKLQDYILKVHKKYNLTTILVSHDIPEVFKLSTRVIKLDNGKIIKDGTPENVFIKKSISGKYRSTGTVLSIEKSDIVNIINVLSANQVLKIIGTDQEIQQISEGDKVMVVSKAFNPLIIKID